MSKEHADHSVVGCLDFDCLLGSIPGTCFSLTKLNFGFLWV